jgi:ketosteroid isomerase-like protein
MDRSSIRRIFGQACRDSRLLPFATVIMILVLSLPTANGLWAADVEQAANLSGNKAVALKFAEEVLNNRKIEAIDDLIQSDAILQLQSNWHSPVSGTSQVVGKDNWKKHYEAFFAIWDKKAEWFKTTIEEVIAEGDTVALRAARVYKDRKSKEVVNRTAMVFYKLKDGKIAAMYLLVAGPNEP